MAYLRRSMGIMAVKGETNGMVSWTIMTIMVMLVIESFIVKRVMAEVVVAVRRTEPHRLTRTCTD